MSPLTRAAAVCLLALSGCGTAVHARGATGAAELTLDRSAVRGLIALALPEARELELPGLGLVGLRIDPPADVRFRDGGVEAELPVHLSIVDRPLAFRVRYVPAVEPLSGVVRLEPASAVPATPLPFEVDLRGLLPPVELPRRLDWELELPGGRRARVTCFVQGLVVEERRLRVELGLVTPD